MSDTASDPKKQVWLILAFPRKPQKHASFLQKLDMRPSRRQPNVFWRRFQIEDQAAAEYLLSEIKGRHLRANMKRVEEYETRVRRSPARSSPARRRSTAPSVEITSIQIAKENRLARDALKLAIEKRRQAERAASVEVNRRAKEVVQRITGI